MELEGSSPPKTCIVCSDPLSSRYFVYITNGSDLEDGRVVLHPFLRLKGGCGLDAFCVLNSKLYWFDGCNDYDGDDPCRRSAHKLDLLELELRRSDLEDLVLEKSDEHKLVEMEHSKSHPAAIASPDGKKIMVFSCWPRSLKNHEVYDFELFDVERPSWTTLAPMSASLDLDPICSYCFQTNSIFLVCVSDFRSNNFRIFSLDMSNPGYDWKCYRHISMIVQSRHHGPFYAIDESLFLTCDAAGRCGQGKKEGVVAVPLPAFGDGPLTDFRSMVVRNVKEEKECTFCNLTIGRLVEGTSLQESGERYPVGMNVVKIDPLLSTPTTLNRLKYTLIAPPGFLFFVAVATLA